MLHWQLPWIIQSRVAASEASEATVGDKTTKILYFVVSMMPVVLQIIQWNMLRYTVAQCPAPKS